MSTANDSAKASGRGSYYDGQSSRRREIDIRFAATLELSEAGAVVARWGYDDIRRVEAAGGRKRYRNVREPDTARLEIDDPALAETIERTCKRLADDKRGQKRALGKILLLCLAAAVSVVLAAIYGMPLLADRIALVVPAGVEVKLGDAVDGQVRSLFRGTACTNAPGKAALTKIVQAIDGAHKSHVPLIAAVIDNRVPNAFALPGGRIYVLRGLLDRAQSQDEVMGVLAHEVGHVVHRHGLRKVFQSGGTAFLLGALFGDVFGGAAILYASQQLLDSAYSRDAETEADGHAAKVMAGLGRSGVAMGRFMARLEKAEGLDLPVFFRSHPLTSERIAFLEKLEKPVVGKPILTDEEWAALKAICQR
jgi:predicted Zn-dependent protease